MPEPCVIVAGTAHGEALRLEEPLSLWGGLDSATGLIIDRHHPQLGQSVAARVVVMASGRGSSSGSSVLAEAVRAGVGPAGIVLAEPDGILAVGGVAIAELYPELRIPIVVAEPSLLDSIATGDLVSITEEGGLIVRPEPGG